MRSLTFLIFVFLTFCCWGLYGPVLHIGQAEMGADGKLSSLRPFICVGIAYFLIAVIFPIAVLGAKGEQGGWTATGFIWSFAAGAIGAIGALGIIFAFKFDGKPVYVMPLVFGCAPIVNTMVTMIMARTWKEASLIFFVGILVVAIGAAGVMTFKPTAKKHAQVESHDNSVAELAESSDFHATVMPTRNSPRVQIPMATVLKSSEVQSDSSSANLVKKTGNLFFVGLSIFVTALCWGAYGPVLHKGQARMNGSRLRPFICVGLAYFAIAVVVPWLVLPFFPEPGGFDPEHTRGILWSMLAGAAGAIGALGIIYAFNAGGRPIFVMPLVFGMAPVINTFAEVLMKGLAGQISPWFFASLAMVIIGACMVLIFAPRPQKPKPATE